MDRLYRDRVALPLCISYLNITELLTQAQCVCHMWQKTIYTDRLVWSGVVYHLVKHRLTSPRIDTFIRHLDVHWLLEFNLDRLQPFDHCTQITIVANSDFYSWKDFRIEKKVEPSMEPRPPPTAMSPIISLTIQVWMPDETILSILQHPRLSQLCELTLPRLHVTQSCLDYLQEMVHLKKLVLTQDRSIDFLSIFDTIHLMPDLNTLWIVAPIETIVRPLPSTITDLTFTIGFKFIDLHLAMFQPCQHQIQRLHLTLTDYLPSSLHRAQFYRFFTWLQERGTLQTLQLEFVNFQQMTFEDFRPIFAPFLVKNSSQLIINSISSQDSHVNKLHFERSICGFASVSKSLLFDDSRPAKRFRLRRFLELFPLQLNSLDSLTLEYCTLTIELARAIYALPQNILRTFKCHRCSSERVESDKDPERATGFMREFFLILTKQTSLTYLHFNMQWNLSTLSTSEIFSPLLTCHRLQHLLFDFTSWEDEASQTTQPTTFTQSLIPLLIQTTWLNELELISTSFWHHDSLQALLSSLTNLHHFNLGYTFESRLKPSAYEPILTLCTEYESIRPIRITINSQSVATWRKERLRREQAEQEKLGATGREDLASPAATLPNEAAPTPSSAPSCCTVQ